VVDCVNQWGYMYIGKYQHLIDAKNRVFIPSAFRAGKKTKFILTQGIDKCLFLYDLLSWKNVLEKIEKLSLQSKVEERAFKRALFSGAYEVVPDAQGRILVPSPLAKYAGFSGETTIVGVGSRVEIWDKELWEDYYLKASSSLSAMSDKLEI